MHEALRSIIQFGYIQRYTVKTDNIRKSSLCLHNFQICTSPAPEALK